MFMELQLKPNTFKLLDTADVVNEGRCVLALLENDCTTLKFQEDGAIVIETGDDGAIYSVAFHSDGM